MREKKQFPSRAHLQVATIISSERTRISFERGFLDTNFQRSRLAALLDSTPFSSFSLTATSWCFERKYWAERLCVEPSGHLPPNEQTPLAVETAVGLLQMELRLSEKITSSHEVSDTEVQR